VGRNRNLQCDLRMNICPHCGFDLERNSDITWGKWRLRPAQTFYEDRKLPLTAQQSEFLFALAKCQGRPLDNAVMYERLTNGSAANPRNMPSVIRHRIHLVMKELNIPDPVAVQHGKGYYWNGEPYV
jgi:hypothetical protein